MIIECEECKSKFRLDEGLLRKEGSRVRCSVCKNVFMAYPPGMEPMEEPEELILEDLGETAAIENGPPALEKQDSQAVEQIMDDDFELAFEEAMEADAVEVLSPDEIVEKEEQARAKEVSLERERKRREPKKGKRETKAAKAAAPAKKKKKGFRLLPILLVIVLLLLGGAAAVYFLAPQLIPNSLSFLKPERTQDIGDLGVRRLAFKAVSGKFVQSEQAGQLFVVRGMVSNNYPRSRSLILVKGTILDDQGKVVKTKLAYAGNVFSEKEMKEMPLEEINQAMRNRFGKGRMNVNIQPQRTVPFMIVFEDLPDNLSEFTVEAVSSSAGD
jgi:predicted Zn finger-like uncharacterized protein